MLLHSKRACAEAGGGGGALARLERRAFLTMHTGLGCAACLLALKSHTAMLRKPCSCMPCQFFGLAFCVRVCVSMCVCERERKDEFV